jgi:transcriptional regulator with XRE-family HTH domain
VRLGDVLKKERQRRGLSAEEVAGALGLARDRYQEIEDGGSPAETWGPRLAEIAIQLETPTSRLLAESGRAADTRFGQAGELIRRHRERRGLAAEQLAAAVGVGAEEWLEVEGGRSPLESYGPLLLRFAEVIEQPVFNLFYPCGLPLGELDDYP